MSKAVPVLSLLLLACSAPHEPPSERALNAALQAWAETGIETPPDCYAFELTVRRAKTATEFVATCDPTRLGLTSCARPDTKELLLAPGESINERGEPVVNAVIAALEFCSGVEETGALETAVEMFGED